MRANPEERGKKLFIGGLHMKTTEETLHGFFSQWGELVDCVVMKDGQSGRSRGFGFVTYKDLDSVDLAQSNRPHEIDGIKVDSKRAMPKEDTSPENHVSVTRLFIGRLRKDMTSEQLNDYFGTFGAVTDAVVIKNPTGESRGFGFVTYEDTDCVDKVILARPHSIDGHSIEVKKAQPKEGARGSGPNNNSNRQPPRQGQMNEGRGGIRSNSYNSHVPNGNPIGAYSNPNMAYNNGYGANYNQGYQQGYNEMPPSRYNNATAQPQPGQMGGYGSDPYYSAGSYSQPQSEPAYPGNYGQYNTPKRGGGGQQGSGAPLRSSYGQAPPQMGDYSQRSSGGGPMRGGKMGRGAPRQGGYPY